MGSTFTINGKVINMSKGGNISVHDGDLIIGGSSINLSQFGDEKVFNIVIQGDVESVNGEFATVDVAGDAGSVKTVSGKVNIEGNVLGNIATVSGKVVVEGGVAGKISTVSGKVVH
jgi:hypothetical protein